MELIRQFWSTLKDILNLLIFAAHTARKLFCVLLISFVTCPYAFPPLSDEQKQTIAKQSKAKDLSFIDVRVVAKQVWLSQLNEEAVVAFLGDTKVALIKNYFPAFFNQPNFNEDFNQVLIRTENQADPTQANRGNAYVIFELGESLPDVDEAPTFGRYAGNEIDCRGNKNRRSMRMGNFYAEASESILKFIKYAKEQDRKFVYVPIVTNTVEDYKQDNVWIRPRFAIEDALKRCIEFLSNETYNKNTISRNEHCETQYWPGDTLVLFSFWLFRHAWGEIRREMNDKNNLA